MHCERTMGEVFAARALLACEWFSAEAFLLEVLITNRMFRVVSLFWQKFRRRCRRMNNEIITADELVFACKFVFRKNGTFDCRTERAILDLNEPPMRTRCLPEKWDWNCIPPTVLPIFHDNGVWNTFIWHSNNTADKAALVRCELNGGDGATFVGSIKLQLNCQLHRKGRKRLENSINPREKIQMNRFTTIFHRRQILLSILSCIRLFRTFRPFRLPPAQRLKLFARHTPKLQQFVVPNRQLFLSRTMSYGLRYCMKWGAVDARKITRFHYTLCLCNFSGWKMREHNFICSRSHAYVSCAVRQWCAVPEMISMFHSSGEEICEASTYIPLSSVFFAATTSFLGSRLIECSKVNTFGIFCEFGFSPFTILTHLSTKPFFTATAAAASLIGTHFSCSSSAEAISGAAHCWEHFAGLKCVGISKVISSSSQSN